MSKGRAASARGTTAIRTAAADVAHCPETLYAPATGGCPANVTRQ